MRGRRYGQGGAWVVHLISCTPDVSPHISSIPHRFVCELPRHDSGKYENECLVIVVAISVLLCKQALGYVSTFYSQCPHCEIKEEVYPVPLDYQQIFDGKPLDEETAKKAW